jgi:lysine 2,3-aminomutase
MPRPPSWSRSPARTPIRSATTPIRRSTASSIAIPTACLLKLVHTCAVYCRFCFRREMVGPGKDALSPRRSSTRPGLYRRPAEIWEVIVTGGDP